jgi:hypothetical protein
MSRSIIPYGLANRYIDDVSLLLATIYLSKRPYLYITQLDHLIDQYTMEYSIATGVNVDSEALGTLSAIGNFANGLGIAAAVGSRTLVSNRSFKWQTNADDLCSRGDATGCSASGHGYELYSSLSPLSEAGHSEPDPNSPAEAAGTQ